MLFLIKMGYFFKIIYLRFLPTNDNFLQDLSTFFLLVCSYKTFLSLIGDIK